MSSSKIAVGAYGDDGDKGSVFVYDLDGKHEQKIVASDGSVRDDFGRAVDISETHILAGAASYNNNNGKVYLYPIPTVSLLEERLAGQVSDLSVIVNDNATASILTSTSNTFTAPQRTSITAEADNIIDFTVNNNFTLTATAGDITVESLIGCTGQSGVIIVTTAENVTGWGVEFKFKNVPLTLTGVETFAYFVESETTIRIGRMV